MDERLRFVARLLDRGKVMVLSDEFDVSARKSVLSRDLDWPLQMLPHPVSHVREPDLK
jgi:hypothetical protein